MKLISTYGCGSLSDVGWGVIRSPQVGLVWWYDISFTGAKEACEANYRLNKECERMLSDQECQKIEHEAVMREIEMREIENRRGEFQKRVNEIEIKEAENMKVFASGAKSTVKKPLYHLIPLRALELLAERFGYGASRHGARNYRKGANDPEFVDDRVNHLFEHVVNFAEHRRRADLAAILCNAAILADIGAFVDDK